MGRTELQVSSEAILRELEERRGWWEQATKGFFHDGNDGRPGGCDGGLAI